MALAGGRLLATGAGLHPLAKAQALVLVAYGVRLGGFLLHRELTLERFKVMAKRIDEKVLPAFLTYMSRSLSPSLCSSLYARRKEEQIRMTLSQ
jgi:hypothetical protein